MSHLVSAEEKNNIMNRDQLKKFTRLSQLLSIYKKSLANSAGIFLGPQYHFDLVRPGAALYGITQNIEQRLGAIEQPVQLFAPIIRLRHLEKGESAGYNSTYINKTDKSCTIATIPIGYADGFLRSLSNKGCVYINGYQAPIIGRVSMDLTIIDVSSVPQKDLFLGLQVEIIGPNITLERVAHYAGTNEYEILARFGNRFTKLYNIK